MARSRIRFLPRFEPLETRDNPVSIVIDYSLDFRGFFDDPSRRAVMEQAASSIANRLEDRLSAIVPGGGNTWSVVYEHPFTGEIVTLTDQVIPADTIYVYALGAALPGSQVADASTGLISTRGTTAFRNAVFGRGQPGASANPPTDYGPWGGFITFDTLTDWWFSADPPPRTQSDFLSVAQHELAHILGFSSGISAFSRFVSDGAFTGPNATSLYGGPVPLTSDGSHWRSDVRFGGKRPAMLAGVASGETQRMTDLDFAALKDIGWQVSDSQTGPPPSQQQLWDSDNVLLAIGADDRDSGLLVDPFLERIATAQPGGVGFAGGVRVAAADVNGDGTFDLISVTGPGTAARLTVIDGRFGRLLFETELFEGFTGGAFVSAGDIDGDGKADIVVTPDRGGGPRVIVFRGGTFSVMADFFGIDDPNFRGGARAAVGDVDGDGFADVIVSAGFQGGPRVAGFAGSALRSGRPDVKLFSDFFAFDPDLRNGVYVAAGDLTGDGKAELVLGAGPGGGPHVRVVDGAKLLAAGTFDFGGRPELMLANFFGGDPDTRGGIRVSARDLNADGLTEVIVGAGEGSGTRVTGYSGKSLGVGSAVEDFRFDAFPGSTAGVFVG